MQKRRQKCLGNSRGDAALLMTAYAGLGISFLNRCYWIAKGTVIVLLPLVPGYILAAGCTAVGFSWVRLSHGQTTTLTIGKIVLKETYYFSRLSGMVNGEKVGCPLHFTQKWHVCHWFLPVHVFSPNSGSFKVRLIKHRFHANPDNYKQNKK